MAFIHIAFLGTGTSHGIPMIGCRCRTCTSDDPRDNRYRSSIAIRSDSEPHAPVNLLIDCPQEFRLQALRTPIPRIDAVFLTHSHADHVFGLDDIRRYNDLQKGEIPIYANDDTLTDIRRIFKYVFTQTQMGGGKPSFALKPLQPRPDMEPVALGSLRVIPLRIKHGTLDILGYRITEGGRDEGGMAYITDCSCIPDETMPLLKNLDLLVLGALRHRPHPTHMTIEQAVDMAAEIGAGRTFFTHMAHDLRHSEESAKLPKGVALAYDTLTVELTI